MMKKRKKTETASKKRIHIDKSLVITNKKIVVNIELNVLYGLNGQKVGNFCATGFIVDIKKGMRVDIL